MSGIKLTVLLPVINQLIKEAASSTDVRYVAILCHSAMRCQEFEEFLKLLFTFANDVIEVIDLFSGDKAENAIALKQAFAKPETTQDLRAALKARCKVLISTPTQFLTVIPKLQGTCSTLVVDKKDMHIALDLSKELMEVASALPERSFKTILTTQFKDVAADETETELKKAFFGDKKALIIQLNEDHRVKTKCKLLSALNPL